MATLRAVVSPLLLAFALSLAQSSRAQLAADQIVTRNFILRSNHAELRERFASAGIDFPADPLSPPSAPNASAMFLNERTGVLTIRATIAEMDIIETVISALTPPPIVQVEAKFIEVRSPGASTVLKPQPTSFTNVVIYTEKQSRAALQKFEATAGADVITPPVITTISGRQARIRAEQTRTLIYDTPPPLPRDTRPDADPTPHNKGRLPFPPTFARR